MTQLKPDDLAPLSRVIAIAIGKGGAGKTSIAANTAGQLAAADNHVLLVSLDPQDNLGEDLGYANAELSDDGAALVAAIRGQQPLQPLKDIRPGLDVACGGDHLEDLVADLYVTRDRGENVSYGLAQALLPLADDYDAILIDCPPGYHVLQHLALVAARWILIPTTSDSSSRKGISRLAARVQEATHHNPHLSLLGVVLFDVPSNATRIRQQALDAIAADLGDQAPVFTTTIRTARAAAHDVRERGQLMFELQRDVDAAPRWWQRRQQAAAGKPATPNLASSAKTVAADYLALTHEILTALAAAEAEEAN